METPPNQWTAGQLLGISGSYWQTCTLHAAVKLDIFSALGTESIAAQDAAQKINADTDATARLLDALTAMGLISKKAGRYINTPDSIRLLTKSSPDYIGYMIMHHHHLVDPWSQLDQAVITGRSVRGRVSSSDEAWRENFLMGMFNIASLTAPEVVKEIDLSSCYNLLDLGGGPGTYAIHFCLQNPHLRATIHDQPTTRAFAEKTIARYQLTDRIDFLAGDYTTTPVSGAFDAIWMSHILHGEDPDTCRTLLKNAFAAAVPGTLVLIHDFILNDAMDGPLFPALFSLNMLLGTQGGRAYSEAQFFELLASAGVVDLERHPFCGPTDSGIIQGRLKT
jgi:hypothetical protein